METKVANEDYVFPDTMAMPFRTEGCLLKNIFLRKYLQNDTNQHKHDTQSKILNIITFILPLLYKINFMVNKAITW